jgi:putative protease
MKKICYNISGGFCMNKIELLSPVGDWDCLLAAVQNGADSVYFGSTLFNARASANNFDVPTLKKAIQYCKLRNVRTFLTLNILIKNSEFNDAINLAQKAYEFGIVQDLGLARYLIKNFPDMPIHGSTQMSIHNLEGVLELQDLGFKRVVLARELPLNEIQYICKNSKIEIETFIHGALCISYSGQCLFSSIIGGRSGNRGKCAGPCRLPYELLNHNNVSNKETTMDKGYLLSPKDLCTLDYLPQLIDAGVKCFKIEGRLKTEYYLASVVNAYRNAIDDYMKNPNEYDYNKYLKELEKTKTRGLTTFYFNDRNNKDFQEYDGKQYNPNFEFGGKVLENQANKTLIEIRNKLSIGDKMEILIPGKIEVEEFTIQKMWDSDTEEEITTVNPGKQGQTVKLELPIEAKTGWILRRRK